MEMKFSQVGCFQITDRWICYSIFFDISFVMFFRDFCQNIYDETIFFQSKVISRCSILQKIKMSNLILKWWPFEYKVKRWKIYQFLGLFFQKQKECWHFEFSWIRYFGNDFMKWHIWVSYFWDYGPSNFKAELKADFWLQIGIYSSKNCPRHSSGRLPPTKT